MNQHSHEHAHHDHQHHEPSRPKRPIHKDWRAWVVVGLMLAAMVMYVMSFDESIQPGGQEGPEMPAAPAEAP